jgi:protease PrsW
MDIQTFSLISIFYILTTIFPLIAWLVLFSHLDRREPEPKKLILLLFLSGILSAFVSIIIKTIFFQTVLKFSPNFTYDYLFKNNYIDNINSIAIISLAQSSLEEIVKFVTIIIVTSKNKNFNQIMDGIVYATTISLGFVFLENTIYFFEFYQNLDGHSFFTNSVLRAITTVMLHVMATGIIGLFIGKAKFKSKNKTLTLAIGLIFGILVHVFFNLFAQVDPPYSYIAFIILIVSSFFLFISISNKKIHKIFQTDLCKNNINN